jgi:hypothetical protein
MRFEDGCLGFLAGGCIGGIVGYYGTGVCYLAYSKIAKLDDNPQAGFLFIAAGFVAAVIGSIIGLVKEIRKARGNEREDDANPK